MRADPRRLGCKLFPAVFAFVESVGWSVDVLRSALGTPLPSPLLVDFLDSQIVSDFIPWRVLVGMYVMPPEIPGEVQDDSLFLSIMWAFHTS